MKRKISLIDGIDVVVITAAVFLMFWATTLVAAPKEHKFKSPSFSDQSEFTLPHD